MATKEQLALKVLKQLVKGTEYEGKVFLAGGAVRDEIMGKPVKDIDLVVSMPDGGIKFAEWLAMKTKSYVAGSNPVIFPRFGTAKMNLRGVKLGDVDLSDVDIETVMTRGEKYEKGSRKPEVVYADLEDDAYRRDLTVNSLFKDIVTDEVKDLTGRGIEDIKNGVVRTPLDPDLTFKDDPLRMLRAVRFATKYNWKMPKSLYAAIKKNADLLQTISKERVQDELNKILMTDKPSVGLKLLSYSGLNKHIIPELDACRGVTQNEYHKDDVFDHIMEVVSNTPPDLNARLAALFHDIGKPNTKSVGEDGRVHFYGHEDVGADMAASIMTRLKYPNSQSNIVTNVVKNHMRLKNAGDDGMGASDKQLRKFVAAVGDNLSVAMKMMHADNISHQEGAVMPNQIPSLLQRMKGLTAQTTAKPTLPINGDDIMKTLKVKPGPVIRDLLSAVEEEWYNNPKLTRNDALKIVADTYANLQTGDTTNASQKASDILNTKIINPVTKHKIKVKSALSYDKNHPAHKTALKVIKQKTDDT